MMTEDLNPRKSWQIKDAAIAADLMKLMKLTDADRASLANLKDAATAASDKLLEDFYSRLLAHEETAEFFVDKLEKAKEALRGWFIALFTGDYGEDFVNSRLRIGETHVRIGLPVRYPLAMMDVIIHHGHAVAAQSPDPTAATVAFNKLVVLDIAIFNQAYEDTQLKHLTKLVGDNEALARRLLTQSTK